MLGILCLSGGAIAGIVIAALIFVAAIIFISCAKVVRQANAIIVERLGKYNRTLNAGINIILPIIEQAKEVIARQQNGRLYRANRIDMREQVYDFDKQSVITKDNVMTESRTI